MIEGIEKCKELSNIADRPRVKGLYCLSAIEDNYEIALSHTNEGLKTAEKLGDIFLQIQGKKTLARIMQKNPNRKNDDQRLKILDEALVLLDNNFEHLKRSLAKTEPEFAEIGINRLKGTLYLHKGQIKKNQASFSEFENALTIANKFNLKALKVQSLIGQLNSAIPQKKAEICINLTELLDQKDILNITRGEAYLALGNCRDYTIFKRKDFYQNAKDIFEQCYSNINYIKSLIGLGNLYDPNESPKELEARKKYFVKARELATLHSFDNLRAKALFGLGNLTSQNSLTTGKQKRKFYEEALNVNKIDLNLKYNLHLAISKINHQHNVITISDRLIHIDKALKVAKFLSDYKLEALALIQHTKVQDKAGIKDRLIELRDTYHVKCEGLDRTINSLKTQ